MRLALTGGGTGGHILPAMTVLEAVRAQAGDGLEVRWFGPADRGERARVEAFGLAFEDIPAAAMRGRGPAQVASGVFRLVRGMARALWTLRGFAPDAVFSTGGYGSFPCSVAARLLRRPLVVYLPDVEPGWAVRGEKRLATRIATTTQAALAFLPKAKTTVTGYPVRSVFFTQTRDEARAVLGLEPGEHVVVIAGATQGAHAINAAVFNGLPELLGAATVFHITGPADEEAALSRRSALGAALEHRYHVSAFRDDLPTVMLASDLAVMRAGASVMGELPAAGLPSILVPATYAGGHQRANAEWLAAAGASVIVAEADVTSVPARMLELLNDDVQLSAMRGAARAAAQPGAAAAIARIVMEAARP